MDVSIIIVSWNTCEILRQCLESIFSQTMNVTFEIVLVDNGSSDGSSEMVARQFPQVKLVRNKKNLGFSRANNVGIRASTGRYLCLVNSDVVVLDNCIDALTKFMDENPSVGIAGPRILNPDRSIQVSCRNFPSIWNSFCQAVGLNRLFPKSAFFSEAFMKYWAHDARREVDVLSGCFWMVRREALNQVGLLDERFFIYGEDVDWCKRFYEHGWGIVFYPDAEAIHFHGASSANDPIRFIIEMQKADLQYWKKYHGFLGMLVYRFIVFLRQMLRVVFEAIRYITRPSERKSTCFKIKRSLACIRWLFTYPGDKARNGENA